MPIQNKSKHIGNTSGSSTVNNPLTKVPTTTPETQPTAVPDVEFSDTSKPVFTGQLLVGCSWNIPVSGFGIAAVNVVWAALNASGATVSGGRTQVFGTDGTTEGLIRLDFPDDTRGTVRVEINENSVISAVDNITFGPPGARSFTVEWDTIEGELLSDPDIQPSILSISKPNIGTWKDTTYFIGFYWSLPVRGFTESDITIEARGTGSAIMSDFQKSDRDNKLYTATITFTGTGTFVATVNPDIARTIGAEEDNSPPKETQQSFAFDGTTSASTFSISGVTVLCSETVPITNHPERVTPAHGGSFLGVSDIVSYMGRIYFTSQIQRKREGRDEISTLNPSAGALVSVPHGGATSCTVHKKYEHFRSAARSLARHRGQLYFFEGSGYVYPRIPRALDQSKLGFVQSINSGGTITEIGLNFRSAFPTGVNDKYAGTHGGTMSPMISHDDDLHMISMKSDTFDINGVQWIVYGKELNQRIPVLETNGKTGFAVIEELASLNNAIYSIHNGEFTFKPRSETQGALEFPFSSTGTSLHVKDRNRDYAWGNSGILSIGDEIVEYTLSFIASNGRLTFTGVTRGLHGTEAAAHSVNDLVVLVDHVINATDVTRPVNEMDIETDGSRIHNHINVSYAIDQVPRTDALRFSTADSQSIMEFGERKFDLELPLDYHQNAWAIRVARDYLKRNKNTHLQITVRLKRNFDIELSDVVYLSESVLSITTGLFQVMSIRQIQSSEETEIILVKIYPEPIDS